MPYTLNYEFGFGSRFFIGSLVKIVVDIFRQGILTGKALYIIIIFSCTILSLLTALLLGKVLRDSNSNPVIIFLVILFLASPASVALFFQRSNFGRLDMFLVIFSLLALFFIRKGKFKILVPILSVFAMATQQVFAFTYFPLIFAILIYDLYENNFSKGSTVFVVSSFIIIGVSFIYFQFFSNNLRLGSVNEFMEVIEKQTIDVPLNAEMIRWEYFENMAGHWYFFVVPFWGKRMIRAVVTLMLISPLHVLFAKTWKNAIRATDDKKYQWFYRLMAFLPLMALPAFILTIDWDRWFVAYIIVQFAIIFYLYQVGDTGIKKSLSNLYTHIKKYQFLYLLYVVFLASLGKFEAHKTVLAIETITDYFYNLFIGV